MRRMGQLLMQVEPGTNRHDSRRACGRTSSRKHSAAKAGICERQRKRPRGPTDRLPSINNAPAAIGVSARGLPYFSELAAAQDGCYDLTTSAAFPLERSPGHNLVLG